MWDGGGDTTILLLHGYLDLGRAWTATAEALADTDWHLVAPDWRGHGKTEWIGRGGYYHFPDYVRDLEQIVAAVRRRRLVVVGHSMGAGVGLLWAGTRPDALDALALVDWPGSPPMQVDDYPQRMRWFLEQTAPFLPRRHGRPMRDFAHAAQRIARNDPWLPLGYAEKLARWAAVEDPDGWVRWRYDPLHRTRAPHPMLPEIAGSFVRRITCPVLWIEGAESGLRAPDLEERLSELRDLRRRSLPRAGHMVQNDRPDGLAHELREFVTGGRTGG